MVAVLDACRQNSITSISDTREERLKSEILPLFRQEAKLENSGKNIEEQAMKC